jgi:hypothetical protein
MDNAAIKDLIPEYVHYDRPTKEVVCLKEIILFHSYAVWS